MKKNIKSLFYLSCMLLFAVTSIQLDTQAQAPLQTKKDNEGERSVGNLRDRLFFGGDFALQFGTNESYVLVAPLAGYRVSNTFDFGLGPYYEFYRLNFFGFRQRWSIYGARSFARFFPLANLDVNANLGNLFLIASFEMLNFPNWLVSDGNRVWIRNLPVGGGFSQPLGGRASFNLTITYNLFHDPSSPYYQFNSFNGFMIRGGIIFGR